MSSNSLAMAVEFNTRPTVEEIKVIICFSKLISKYQASNIFLKNPDSFQF